MTRGPCGPSVFGTFCRATSVRCATTCRANYRRTQKNCAEGNHVHGIGERCIYCGTGKFEAGPK